jgi:hypothetical protein
MKGLLRKKWFRILARTLVVMATMLVLAVSVFNWQAARAKERAIAEAKTAGLALSAGDLVPEMPPGELNFARHGIFALIEDGLSLPEERRSPEQKNAIESYKALGDEGLLRDLNRKRENKTGGPIDFSFLPDDGSYGKTATSFLAEYDRRHAAVLDEIRSGMQLPYVRRQKLPKDFAGGDSWITLNEGFGFTTSRAQRGLRLRTEAALATGDVAKAAESIAMSCRLGELTSSRGFLVSVLIDFASFRTVKNDVKRGMDRGLWTAEALDRISAVVAREDVRARMIQGAATEAAMVQVFEAWKHDRKRIAPYLNAGVFGGKIDADPGFLSRLAADALPNGMFDRAATAQLDEIREVVSLIQNPAPALGWWKAAEQMRKRHKGRNGFSEILSGDTAAASLLEIGSRTLVQRQLILTACALERHRLTHGAFPESLSDLPAEIASDPILGGTLLYERTGNTFRLYTPGPPREGTDSKPDPRANDWIW